MVIGLLASPGRSNFDSWNESLANAAVKKMLDKHETKLEVIVFDYWTMFRGRPSRLDLRLNGLRVGYRIALSDKLYALVIGEQKARAMSFWFHLLGKAGLSRARRMFALAMGCPITCVTDLPHYRLVLGDMFIFSKQANSRMVTFLASQTDTVFASMFHGTLDLEPARTPHSDWVSRRFPDVGLHCFFSTDLQAKGYSKFLQGLETSFKSVAMTRHTQPRFQESSKLSRHAELRRDPGLAIFISRNRTDFKGFGFLDSIRSLVQMLQGLEAGGIKTLIVRTHPNESATQTRTLFVLSKWIAGVTRLKVKFSEDWTFAGSLPVASFSWFSGLSVEANFMKIPTFEVRKDGENKFGPDTSQSHWNELAKLGLVERLHSQKDLVGVFSESNLTKTAAKQYGRWAELFEAHKSTSVITGDYIRKWIEGK